MTVLVFLCGTVGVEQLFFLFCVCGICTHSRVLEIAREHPVMGPWAAITRGNPNRFFCLVSVALPRGRQFLLALNCFQCLSTFAFWKVSCVRYARFNDVILFLRKAEDF